MDNIETVQYFGLYIGVPCGVKIAGDKHNLNPVYNSIDYIELDRPTAVTAEHFKKLLDLEIFIGESKAEVLRRFLFLLNEGGKESSVWIDSMCYPSDYMTLIDKLRELGYATPWKKYSVEDLIEKGVLQLK